MVLEIFLPSLEQSPWDTFFEYLAGCHDVQTVVLLEQFWKKYFSPAWRPLPGIDFLNVFLKELKNFYCTLKLVKTTCAQDALSDVSE